MSERSYKKYSDYSLEMMTEANSNMNVLRGKGLLNVQESRFTFVQNAPRGPRSVEVGRTAHSRFVRRPDGMYTATIRFDASDKYIVAALIAEVRAIARAAQADWEVQKAKVKEEKKGGEDD